MSSNLIKVGQNMHMRDVSQAAQLSPYEDQLSEPKSRRTVPHLFRVNLPGIPGAGHS